jgi:pimeloyl-ACP methyl ester carboxylesterase
MKKVGILVFVGFLSLASNAFAQTGDSKNTKPTIVFVHGLWADGSSWSKVINPLVDKGYKVISVQNPTTSLKDDVTATKRAIDRADGDVILVGHSWGGSVITEAGADQRVKALVYVAAFAPDEGETAGSLA